MDSAREGRHVREIRRRSLRQPGWPRGRRHQPYLACPARIDLQELRCPGGADSGTTCLSDAQIAGLKALHSPYQLPFPLANGIAAYPQWLYGNEITPDGRSPHMVRWF